MDNTKTWTGLSEEESIRMTEDRDKWRKYVGSKTAKEQNTLVEFGGCESSLDAVLEGDEQQR